MERYWPVITKICALSSTLKNGVTFVIHGLPLLLDIILELVFGKNSS